MSSCELMQFGRSMYVCMCVCMMCMYTRILISDFSVLRTFTSMPINGLNIKFYIRQVTLGSDLNRSLYAFHLGQVISTGLG